MRRRGRSIDFTDYAEYQDDIVFIVWKSSIMIDQMRQMALFARTVEEGSFRGAARALGLSPAVVSHHVAALEGSLGTALLYRSTRRLSLTRDGERLLAAARVMVDAAESGLQAVSSAVGQPSGTLRVTAPSVLAHSALMARLAAFSAAHPNVVLDIDFSDEQRDLIGQGYDLAIRMGRLRDSSLKSRRIDTTPRVVVAGPGLVAAHGQPAKPGDLDVWPWLSLKPAHGLTLAFRRAQRTVTIRPDVRVRANDAWALYQMVRAGAGLAIVPRFLASDDIASGRVVAILPEWAVEPIGIFAVWPANARRTSLTGRLIDALLDPAWAGRQADENKDGDT